MIMLLVKRKLPFVLPLQISIVDVRDVAEAHVQCINKWRRWRPILDGCRRNDVEGYSKLTEKKTILKENGRLG